MTCKMPGNAKSILPNSDDSVQDEVRDNAIPASEVGSSYSLDEMDTASPDCRACITTGNKVSLVVKVSDGTNKTDNYYMWINTNEHLVIKRSIADPDSVQVLFNWINLKNMKGGFALILQNSFIQGGVVGIESFADGEPLTLQVQDKTNERRCVMYKHDSGDYFSLHFQSSDKHFYYVLPMNGTLRIYKDETIKYDNCYVFRIGSYKCSNSDGPCPFKRLMKFEQ